MLSAQAEDNPIFRHHEAGPEANDVVDGSTSQRRTLFRSTGSVQLEDVTLGVGLLHQDQFAIVGRESSAVLRAAGVSTTRVTSQTAPNEHLCLVSCQWNQSSGPRRLEGLLALLDVAPNSTESKEFLTTITKEFSTTGLDIKLVRHSGSRLLISCFSDETLQKFISLARESKLKFPINKISVAYEAESTYPCYTHLSLTSKTVYDQVFHDVEKAIVNPYGGNLFVHVAQSTREDNSTEVSQEISGSVPRMITNMLLNPKLSGTQNRFQMMSKEFDRDIWKKIERDRHRLENTQVYVHSKCPQSGFGMCLTTATNSGIQFIINASSDSVYPSLVKFYKSLLKHDGLSKRDQELSTCILPLSKTSELIVRSAHFLNVMPASQSVSLNLRPDSLNHFTDYLGVNTCDSGKWLEVIDPDGNIVNLTVPLK